MKSFTKWQKEVISSIIDSELQVLSEHNYQSENLQKCIDDYIKLQNANLTKFEIEMVKNSLKDMLSDFNITINEEELDFEKINDPAFKKKIEEKIKDKHKEEQERKKQAEKEQKIEKTDIDFQKIYKNLAKISHPDLYRLEDEKAIKQEQMQRLTLAWEERDYYQLLMLWLEIDPENKIKLNITETNQKNIIAQLNEKINKIEAETHQVKFHFQDTAFYYQFDGVSEKKISNKIQKYKKHLNKSIEATNLRINDVEKTKKFKEILGFIYESNQQNEYEDF